MNLQIKEIFNLSSSQLNQYLDPSYFRNSIADKRQVALVNISQKFYLSDEDRNLINDENFPIAIQKARDYDDFLTLIHDFHAVDQAIGVVSTRDLFQTLDLYRIFRALSLDSTYKRLFLQLVRIPMLLQILDFLKTNQTIITLHLGYNLNNVAIEAIKEMLKFNTTINEIYVDNGPITDPQIRAILDQKHRARSQHGESKPLLEKGLSRSDISTHSSTLQNFNRFMNNIRF